MHHFQNLTTLDSHILKSASPDLIDSVEKVEALASSGVLKDWTKDLLTTEATQLMPETSYSFAVLVKDASGRKMLYAVKTETTSAAPPFLIVFDTNTVALPFATGEQTWAEAADAKCSADTRAKGGVFKALLVDGTTRRACATPDCSGEREGIDWVLRPNMEYRRSYDENVIATTNVKALLPNPLTTPVADAGLAMAMSWTGLNTDWTTGSHCSNWSTADSSLTPTWKIHAQSNYLSATTACDATNASFICVQQSALGPDTVAPVSGTDISLVNRTSNELQISWGKATDDRTPTNGLKYKLVWAANSTSIDTIAKVDQMTSNVLLDWNANNQYTHTGLTLSTTYHYAVLVKDSAGNLALYPPKSFATLGASKKIFVTAGTWVGDMEASTPPDFTGMVPSPLDKADANCMGDANKPSGGGTYKAMIVHSQRQACSDSDCTASSTGRVGWIFSANTAYARPDGTAIGSTDANAVLTFPLSATLEAGGKAFASGFNATWGAFSGFNCSDWTDNTGSGSVGFGDTSSTGSGMLSAEATGCNQLLPLVCVEQ